MASDTDTGLVGELTALTLDHYGSPLHDDEFARSPVTVGELRRWIAALSRPSADFAAVVEQCAVQVRKVETVKTWPPGEEGEPFWRIEIGGYCADFDHEEAANNFAAAIRSIQAPDGGGAA